MSTYIAREIEDTVIKVSGHYPVVTILGPRQSGKTTLIKRLFPHHSYVKPEFPDDRLLATEVPPFFLQTLQGASHHRRNSTGTESTSSAT